MPVDMLDLSRMHFPVTTLGPGERIGIWFQGCSLKCPGCISVDTWKRGKAQIPLEKIYCQIDSWAAEADGITISGGEPFEQYDQLESLLSHIKETYPNLSVLVYSGFSYEVLRDKVAALKGLIDAIISEPYEQENPSLHPWMGSANQQLHLLSERSRIEFTETSYEPNKQAERVDATFVDDQLWMTGILKQGALEELAKHLEKQGHKINHTQHSVRNIKRM